MISAVTGQQTGNAQGNATSTSKAFPGNVTVGNRISVQAQFFSGSTVHTPVAADCTKSAGTATIGTVTLDIHREFQYNGTSWIYVAIWSCLVTGSGSCTMQIANFPAGSDMNICISEFTSTIGRISPSATLTNSNTGTSTAVDSGNVTTATSVSSSLIIGCGVNTSGTIPATWTEDAAFTKIFSNLSGATVVGGSEYRIVTVATTDSASWTDENKSWTACVACYQEAVNFDVAGNSGDQAAASSYSGSASWNGVNRFLAVDVSLLGPGTTVTSMTYGGAACTFIGSKATVTSLGSVESWGIAQSAIGAPAVGANTLALTLSGSIEFSVEWVSYDGVEQIVPTEAYNSAQATNVGAADATVSVTTVTNNDWVHGAVVASDTSITAVQTTRNNIPGTLGSGANEDNNAVKTPAGAVTMRYTGVGAGVTWAIGGYGIRPAGSDTMMGQICI